MGTATSLFITPAALLSVFLAVSRIEVSNLSTPKAAKPDISSEYWVENSITALAESS